MDLRKKAGSGIAVCFVAAILFLPGFRAYAGSLRVIPSSIFLDSETKTASVRIKNGGQEKMKIQIEVYSWTQDSNGNDVQGETKEFVAFPKMLKIDGDSERTIRVGYRGKPFLKERAYRLYVRELPARNSSGGQVVRFSLRIGLPVFIAPARGGGKEIQEVENVSVIRNKFAVTVKNRGNIHLKIKLITVDGMNSSGKKIFTREAKGWYVLPGVSKPFNVKMSRNECLKLSNLKVTVETVKTSTSREVAVSRSWCEQLRETSEKPEP
ncbi:MAG: hypothetical protein IEMM0002_0195 [bacterium]|nr:MAG: hypothetical protein IEMM0002_0195 [bacterium]